MTRLLVAIGTMIQGEPAVGRRGYKGGDELGMNEHEPALFLWVDITSREKFPSKARLPAIHILGNMSRILRQERRR